MKTIFLTITTVLLLTNCGGNKSTESKTTENEPIQTDNSATSRRIIEDIKQYFATFKPIEVTTMVLDKEGFEKNFNPGRTMDVPPTIIDFDTYKVGAIVVPETAYETEIVLDEVSIIDRKLVITYSITHEDEERSFTIIPIRAFQYSPQLSIDSVSFVNNDITQTYAK